MPTATMSSKGQLTIPKDIRRKLNLAPGDRIEFRVGPDGGVYIARGAAADRSTPRPKRDSRKRPKR